MTAGTNPVGTYGETSVMSQTPSAWFAQADANSAVAQRVADAFAPHPQASPNMTVAIDAGFLAAASPAGLQVVTEVAAQNVTIGTAPSSPNNRIDLIVVDDGTGTASVIAGTPASSPVAPAITAGKKQIAQVSVPNGTSAIAAANITDLRAVWHALVPGVKWAVASGSADAITAAYTPAAAALADGLILGFRATAANATTTPSFAPDGLTAHTITKKGGSALLAGDIPGALAECLVRYNLANTRWELLNPAAAPVDSVFGRTGAVAAANGDYTVSQVTGAAPLASPALTGNPTAPTQTSTDNSTKLATTAFVQTAAASVAPPTTYGAVGTYATVFNSSISVPLGMPYWNSFPAVGSMGTLTGLSGTWRNMGYVFLAVTCCGTNGISSLAVRVS